MTSPRADGPIIIRIRIAFNEAEPKPAPHPLDQIADSLVAHYGPGAPSRPRTSTCTCHQGGESPLDAAIYRFLTDLG
ncbi:hypothetical protein AB0F20_29805 [Streptomyces goshikiensis]|uniref:hypothetical protein n=1 Tax=Streptomyces goshikiensis TaxID=1942 RepID=UPI00340E549E